MAEETLISTAVEMPPNQTDLPIEHMLLQS